MENIEERPLSTLTIGEFLNYVAQYFDFETKDGFTKPDSPSRNHRLVYGLRGIQELFGCSHKQAQFYKDHVINEAVSQRGRKIVVDADLALSLFNERRTKK